MIERVLLQVPGSELRYRLREPRRDGVPPVVMLHGLSGDEKAMWVLESTLPEGGLVASARGPYALSGGGYSWVSEQDLADRTFAAYGAAVEAIGRLAESLEHRNGIRRSQLVLMGFSQGAALAFAAAMRGFTPAGVVALAAYLPEGDLSRASGLPVYWGHGTQDALVPVGRARRDVARLRRHGAEVTYCEAEVGHKVGLECVRDLQSWFDRLTVIRDYGGAERGKAQC